ncbi:D-arabinono-1,4-lactone oxidase [Nocardioides sp. Kera G14]|uniref:D-arabinono-1,4-lactone oxidase n=1 Tax=Nocardioides sp. Kera G14 TaxID=2884264 RepID=UPI001D119832|nr:D-arabinono-1,4-lactone oxidase [Nocardioides sp. Kera G14]UDY22371.1 FAD-binding protein [Nocardioides sp. Kera G14]
MPEWRNWSGLESATPGHVVTPRSPGEVITAVTSAAEAGRRVKMVGTGHSFTGISAPVSGNAGVMLSPTAMTGILAVDRDAMTVTAAAGTQLKHLNAALESLGLSLHNMGDIAEQTLAGAISTGTHGTGGLRAGLGAQVAGLEMVTADGELVAVTEEDGELLDLVRVGLGAVGIIVSVTFRVEPLFGLRATETPMAWDEFVGSFTDLIADDGAGRSTHVDAYWFPHSDRVATKRNVRVELDELDPLPGWKAWLDDDFMQNTLFGALCRTTNRFPRAIPRANRFAASQLAHRTYADVAHKVFVAERRVVFREMEYAVPLESGLDVLEECRRAVEASDLRINFPVELRVGRAESPALSTAHGRDSLYLAFHTHAEVDHRPYFALIEPILAAADGRPHWGKVHTRTAAEFADLYPRFNEFVALRDRLDPRRVFSNAYLERVLGS